MCERDFLVWQNLAWQAEAHLLEHGQRIPVETRALLARIRDLAQAMGEQGRNDLAATCPTRDEDRPASDAKRPLRLAGAGELTRA